MKRKTLSTALLAGALTVLWSTAALAGPRWKETYPKRTGVQARVFVSEKKLDALLSDLEKRYGFLRSKEAPKPFRDGRSFSIEGTVSWKTYRDFVADKRLKDAVANGASIPKVDHSKEELMDFIAHFSDRFDAWKNPATQKPYVTGVGVIELDGKWAVSVAFDGALEPWRIAEQFPQVFPYFGYNGVSWTYFNG